MVLSISNTRAQAATEPGPAETPVRLPWGLLGFESVTTASLASDPALLPLQWLGLPAAEPGGFIVLDPAWLGDAFEIDIDDADCESIGVSAPGDVRLLVIVTLAAGRGATANLKGPLLYNPRAGCMRQIIPRNAASLPIQYPLPTPHAGPEPQGQ